MSDNKFEALMQHLNGIREKYGDDAYKSAATDIAGQFLAQGGETAAFAREAFKGVVDFDAVEKQRAEMPADNPILAAIQQQVPGIKSQAQFNVFMAAFDALRATMNAIFTGNDADEAKGKKALESAYEAAHKATEITGKLTDVPEAATSKAAEEFKNPPRQFTELAEQRALLTELGEIKSTDDLNTWYAANRSRIDRVVSQSLRNALFDSIRQKRDALSASSV